MDHWVIPAVMLAQFMDLCVAVVTAGNTVVRARGLYLLIFQLSVFETLILESRLEETTATAATIVVRPVGLHVDEIFFADN